jgi:predicted metal-dependent enzyme (double-stranded beta helix superfamily)
MEIIDNIEDLKKKIDAANKQDYLEIMKRVDIPITDFEGIATWDPNKYTRNYISSSSSYELILVCWEPGHNTPIHDYNFQQAWIHPVQGMLREERFIFDVFTSALIKVSSVKLEKGDFSFMNNVGGIHRYTNVSKERAMSIHLYSNPVKEWRSYDEKTGEYQLIPLD